MELLNKREGFRTNISFLLAWWQLRAVKVVIWHRSEMVEDNVWTLEMTDDNVWTLEMVDDKFWT